TTRAEAIHLALQALRARVEPDRVLACELAWEVHRHGYWSQVVDSTVASTTARRPIFARSLASRGAPRTSASPSGRMLLSFGEPERLVLRAASAEIGLAKASIVAPLAPGSGLPSA